MGCGVGGAGNVMGVGVGCGVGEAGNVMGEGVGCGVADGGRVMEVEVGWAVGVGWGVTVGAVSSRARRALSSVIVSLISLTSVKPR